VNYIYSKNRKIINLGYYCILVSLIYDEQILISADL